MRVTDYGLRITGYETIYAQVRIILTSNLNNCIIGAHLFTTLTICKDTIPVIFSGSTERTSFAEKNDEKGFYHLNFQ